VSLLGEPPKENHADDDAGTRRRFECLVDRVGEVAAVATVAIVGIAAAPEDETEEGGDEVDGEDVVGVEEEADAGD
jgi:hypothetical protein